MRVVFDARYIHDHFPGIGRYTYNVAMALADLGDDRIRFLVDRAHFSRRYDRKVFLDRVGDRAIFLDSAPTGLTGLMRSALALARISPSLYHSPFYVIPPIPRLPAVLTIFDIISLELPELMPSGRARLLFGLAITRATRRAAHTVVPSRQTWIDVSARLGVPLSRMSVIPLGCEARFRPPSGAQIRDVRERLGLVGPFILYVGINKPHKNIDRLVTAFARTCPEIPHMLVLGGRFDARYPTGLETAERLGVADRVVLLGEVEDSELPALYGAADVFAFPSLYEGFGLPPLEAMACGTPVVASWTSALPEVVGDGGILVDPRSTNAIGEAIARIVSERALRQRLVQAALRQSEAFRWESVAQSTAEVYDRVVHER